MMELLNNESLLGFISNIRGSQLLIIVVVFLLLFGTRKLPDIAKGVGKAIREFRKSASGAEKEFREAMDTAEEKTAQQPEPVKVPVSTEADKS